MKKILALIITALSVFSFINVFAEEAFPKEGIFCEGVTYSLSEDRVLTLTGKGIAVPYNMGLSFQNNSLRIKEIIIGEGITEIGEDSFYWFRDLERVSFPSTLEKIGRYAFGNCYSLTDLDFPEGLKEIEGWAFWQTGLKEAKLPDSLTFLGSFAFADGKLEKAYVGKGLKVIEINPFSSEERCLMEIKVDPENPYFKDIDGVLFTKDGKCLYSYPSGKRELKYTLPETVETVKDSAFYYTRLYELNLNEGLKILEPSCFTGYYNLAELNLPSTLEEIRASFPDGVKKIIIPESVWSMGRLSGGSLVDMVFMGNAASDFSYMCEAKSAFHHHKEGGTWTEKGHAKCNLLVDEVSPWAKAEVEAAKAAGLVTYRTSAGFKSRITRSEFTELLVNMTEKALGHSLPLAEENFADTENTAVSKAKAALIAAGAGENRFYGGDFITREEAATLILRAISFIETEKGTVAEKNTSLSEEYADRDKVSAWAVTAVATLNKAGIMKGTTEKTFNPKGTANVEESILLVKRVYDLIINQ